MKKFWISFISLGVLVSGFWLIPKPPLLEGVDFSQAVFSESGTLLRLTLSHDQQYRNFTPLAQISQHVQEATLLQEDQYFYSHFGINPIALIKGFWVSFILKHRRQGGSTISMQVARMRYHLKTNTVMGKLIQMYYALLLERSYSKRQILQAYLNLAPYGNNVEGIGAASLIYFHTKPSQLTLAQALSLVVIPQNPLKRAPSLRLHNKVLLKARQRLASRWKSKYGLSQFQKISLRLPLQLYSRHELPFKAPHFVDYVLSHARHTQHITTTLDLPLQDFIAHLSHQTIQHWKQRGIKNLAVVLIDTNTMSTKAMLGSANYFDNSIDGQVNGTNAKRSPGSTLKPFIYALAIDKGLITPKSLVFDIPTRFNHYSPIDMDGRYFGPLTATQALVLSRNIPAVSLEQQLGEHDLYHLLKQANISDLQSRKHYGLSLALGSGEVTMLELTKLYAMLVNGGDLRAIRFQRLQAEPKGKSLLSPEASYITLDMLTHHSDAKTLTTGAWLNPKLSIAWKTGTSSGNRDAWSVGVFSHYVIAVWVGDFKAHSNPYLIGGQAAAPLMFSLISGIAKLHPNLKNRPIPTNLNIKKLKVCSTSGMIPSNGCPRLVQTWFIPGVSPIKKSNILQNSQNSHLKIKTLQNHGIYYLTDHTKQFPLRATSSPQAKQFYWFIDHAYLGKTDASDTLTWTATLGQHTLSVVDSLGETCVLHFGVKT